VTAIAARLDALLPQRDLRVIMIEEAGELLGHLFLVLSMTWHARYVIREALGLLPAEKPKAERPAAKPKTAVPASHISATPKRSDLDTPARSAAPQVSASSVRSKPTVDDDADDYDDEEDDSSARRNRDHRRIDDEDDALQNRKLNKAQLKALRRQKEAQRRRDG
jgi:hypothetical protein